MTEGNIATWNVKEGDAFAAGDVLLEIETDKATMDVEAQEDGVMFKIMQDSGAKGVAVGTRIAVLAEAGDDIASLEVPADTNNASAPAAAAPPPTPSPSTSSSDKPAAAAPKAAAGAPYPVRHPLYPSVEALLRANGVPDSDVSKIRPTGPGGRLLKGDVLAYVGAINPDTPAAIESRFDKLAVLDLSNIKVKAAEPAPAKEEAAAPKKEKQAAPAPPPPVQLNLPVSLSKVVDVQNKIHDTLGVFLPLSTFISRAADVANDDLPLPARREPTAAELFDKVLGLDKVRPPKTASRGFYLPQISAVTPPSSSPAPARRASNDIIDILAGNNKKPARPASLTTVPGLSSGPNVFSLVVPKTEEARALAFLERCKLILEEEPGRLVL